MLGVRAVSASALERSIELDSGEVIDFDRLLIATGSSVRKLVVPGSELEGVRYLRTLDDARALRLALARAEQPVIVGAGLIALEVAAAARTAGKAVTVVEAGAVPMRRLLGSTGGHGIARLHEDHGVRFRFGTTISRVLGSGFVQAVELSDGTRMPTDLLLVAIGVDAATGWLEGSGIRVADGVVVDPSGVTNVPHVFAAGDVASTYSALYGRHLRIEQYGNAHVQGALVGRNMSGASDVHAAIPSTSTEQFGVRIQFIGRAQDADQTIMRGSEQGRSFTLIYLKAGAARAALCVNRPRDFAAARKLVSEGSRVDREVLRNEDQPLTDSIV
jgi:3-phenylpropionate/trans-cinnamate dioxygenase ferredoxin reductase subunit